MYDNIDIQIENKTMLIKLLRAVGIIAWTGNACVRGYRSGISDEERRRLEQEWQVLFDEWMDSHIL